MNIDPSDIITLDFETFFDKDYTLKKQSTSEYVLDERFKAQCVGIKDGDKPTIWVPDRHVADALQTIDWGSKALLCHHTQFDGFILTQRFNRRPAYYLDPLSMGRALHSVGIGGSLDALAGLYQLGNKTPNVLDTTKGVRDLPPELMEPLGLYCAMDTELCRKLFDAMIDKFNQDELDLIDITARMFCEPKLLIDIPRVQTELDNERKHKADLVTASGIPGECLRSNDKLAQVLRDRGVQPPTKTSPTTGKTTWAFSKTDFGFQELLVHPDENIRSIAEARAAVKSTIGETRAERFIEAGRDGRKLPVYLKYYGAHTGRWSAGNRMNLQNLRRGGELRKSILAPPGYRVVVADSAQIEARMLAWIADDEPLLQQFRNKEDVYKDMASSIYNVAVDEVNKVQRFVGKVAVLGLGYQMGAPKFQTTLQLGLMGPKVDITISEASKVVSTYRKKRIAIKRMWERAEQFLSTLFVGEHAEYKCLRIDGANDKIHLPNGMYLHYPGLTCDYDPSDMRGYDFKYYDYENAVKAAMDLPVDKKKAKHLYGGIVVENLTQALARIVVGEQMLKIRRRHPEYDIVTMTHDEIVIITPEAQADEALENMITIMRTPPDWAPDLPLDAEGGHDVNYSK